MATWVKTNAPNFNFSYSSFTSVACSSNGKKIVATVTGDYIYTSVNSGATWTQQAVSLGRPNWKAVSSSADGTKLVAGTDRYLYTSTDSGVTWTQRISPQSIYNEWTYIKCSSTGQIVYAACADGIYKSTNYGANWSLLSSSPAVNYSDIACNSTGTFIVAVFVYSKIYTSSDSGATWTRQTGSSDGEFWRSVACNSTGSKIVACGLANSSIYTSTDYGVTWTQTSAPSLRWRSIASSSDGSIIFAATDGTDGYIYLSTDSGTTWIQQPSSGPGIFWACIATSADGNSAVAITRQTDYFNNTTAVYTYIIPPPSPPCFKEGTKILTMKGYKLVQDLRIGDMIKTLRNDYKAIEMIGKKEFIHNPTPEDRVKEQLYVCSKPEFDQIIEPLVITGCHSILVDKFVSEEQKQKTIEVNGKIYATDKKYRLPACAHHATTVYDQPGTYTIYHLALENEDYFMNYGIYANGLLVESCSRRYLKELSDMDLIE